MISVHYPPATGYERPQVRRFWIWEDRTISYRDGTARRRGWGQHPWRWCCTFCDPPAFGFRAREGAWQAIVTISMPRHFRVRYCHHQYVARYPGRVIP